MLSEIENGQEILCPESFDGKRYRDSTNCRDYGPMRLCNLNALTRLSLLFCVIITFISIRSELIAPLNALDVELLNPRFHVLVEDGEARCIIRSNGDVINRVHLYSFHFLSYEYSLVVSWPDRAFEWQIQAPILPFVFLLALVPAVSIRRASQASQKAKRLAQNCCTSCGYDLRSSKDRCPECGLAIPNKQTKPIGEDAIRYLRDSAKLVAKKAKTKGGDGTKGDAG
jgi:hypothetical protein